MSPIRHGSDRFNQEVIGGPIADRIYHSVFGSAATIERTHGNQLDKEFSIDGIIRSSDFMPVTFQEKFLSFEYSSFRSLTVEYMQDHQNNEQGNWFHLACQLYFVGYLTESETAFNPWVLVDVVKLNLATIKKEIVWKTNVNKDGRARASFRYVIMDSIPGYCIIASGL
jgi:hypothetical protein